MTSETTAASGAGAGAGASPQEISGVFRGSADGSTGLQDTGKQPGRKTEQEIGRAHV